MTATRHTPHQAPDLFALSEIHGPVLRPGNDAYVAEVTGFNLSAFHNPDVVVGAAGVDDIVTAMRWAGATRTPVAVQATGHGANFPIEGGLLISTTRMTDVTIDPAERTATVAAGARWRDVLEAAAPYGLAPLNGSSSDAGVVGYTLGGGLPVLGRTYGYAADRVRSVQVVTPDATLRTVTADTEPDLFWALRGGKGNVGVVTELTFELVPVATVLGGGIYFPGEHAETVLHTWADWTTTLPIEMCSAYTILRLPPIPQVPEPLRGGFWARVALAWTGDAKEGENLLTPIRRAAPVAIDTVEEMPYAAIDRIYLDPHDPLPAREACTLLRTLPPDARTAFLDRAGPAVPDLPLLLIELRHMGGELARPAPVEDAICARDASYLLETVGVLPDPDMAAAVESATKTLHHTMSPWSTGHTMVNLHGRPGDEKDRARAWSDEVYTRLTRTKSHYDPDNLLRYGHTVSTTPA